MNDEYERTIRQEALKTAKPVWIAWPGEEDGMPQVVPKQVFLAWGGTRRAHLLDEHADPVHRACAEAFETREHCAALIEYIQAKKRLDVARSALLAAARDAAASADEPLPMALTEAVRELDVAERAEPAARAHLDTFPPLPRVAVAGLRWELATQRGSGR